MAGEDSDSIFEEHLQHEARFEDMDLSDDYDEEMWNNDELNEMNEMKAEVLPMETILEENSIIQESPPQADGTKTKGLKPATKKT